MREGFAVPCSPTPVAQFSMGPPWGLQQQWRALFRHHQVPKQAGIQATIGCGPGVVVLHYLVNLVGLECGLALCLRVGNEIT